MDTRNKKASSIQILAPWQLAPPWGAIDQAVKQHIAWTSASVLAVAPITPTTPASRIFTPKAETREFAPASETRVFVPKVETRIFTA